MAQVIKVVISFAVFVFGLYWYNTTEFGSDIARQKLPRTLLSGLLFAAFVNSSWLLLAVIYTIFVLGAWILRLRHMLRRPVTGQILLHWKRTREKIEVVGSVAGALLGILLIVGGLTHQPSDILTAYIGLLFSLFILTMLIEKDACLTERGLDTGRDYIRWDQIEFYRWSEPVKPVVHLFFKTSRRLPFMNLVQFDVPYEEKEAVNEIVKQKVPSALVRPEEQAQAES